MFGYLYFTLWIMNIRIIYTICLVIYEKYPISLFRNETDPKIYLEDSDYESSEEEIEVETQENVDETTWMSYFYGPTKVE